MERIRRWITTCALISTFPLLLHILWSQFLKTSGFTWFMTGFWVGAICTLAALYWFIGRLQPEDYCPGQGRSPEMDI